MQPIPPNVPYQPPMQQTPPLQPNQQTPPPQQVPRTQQDQSQFNTPYRDDKQPFLQPHEQVPINPNFSPQQQQYHAPSNQMYPQTYPNSQFPPYSQQPTFRPPSDLPVHGKLL